jgi:SSS family solute:Na+ symporter
MVGGQALQGIVAFAGAGGLAAWMTTAGDVSLRYIPANTLGVPELPWPAAVIGACVVALWYWTGDHFVVQRFLAARDLKSIRRGSFIAAIMVLLAAPFVFPLPLQEAGTQPLPPLAAGVLATVISAVVMAAMAGYFHSAAALFTMDFYVARHSAASDRRLVNVGRMATAGFVVLALILVSFLALTASSNTVLVQRLQMYLAAPVSALMIAVLFSKRTIARGAAIGLAAGGTVEALHATAWLLSPGGTLDGLAGIETAYVAFAAFVVTLSVVLLSGTPATPATPSGISVIPKPDGSLRMDSGWRRAV